MYSINFIAWERTLLLSCLLISYRATAIYSSLPQNTINWKGCKIRNRFARYLTRYSMVRRDNYKYVNSGRKCSDGISTQFVHRCPFSLKSLWPIFSVLQVRVCTENCAYDSHKYTRLYKFLAIWYKDFRLIDLIWTKRKDFLQT